MLDRMRCTGVNHSHVIMNFIMKISEQYHSKDDLLIDLTSLSIPMRFDSSELQQVKWFVDETTKAINNTEQTEQCFHNVLCKLMVRFNACILYKFIACIMCESAVL